MFLEIDDKEGEKSIMENNFLSICIIVKNEEKRIQKCLQSFEKYGFEVVVVDTGSSDHTKDVALKYTQNVYDFKWCDDFSKARNFAISKASGNYVMVIDSDEYLKEINLELLKKNIIENQGKVGRIQLINILKNDETLQENYARINRIFDKRRFCYEGKIHEQIVSKNGTNYDTYIAPVVIEHSGYNMSIEERKKKTERNIRLLEKELKQLICDDIDSEQCLEKVMSEINNIEDHDGKIKSDSRIPYILYQLGKGFYMSKDYKKSCFYFESALQFNPNFKLEYVVDLIETYGYALLNSQQEQKALMFENIYDDFGVSADFKFLMGLIYMNNGMYADAIKEFKGAQEFSHVRMQGVNTYLANYNIGVIYECLGNCEEAKNNYRLCGDYSLAKKRLELLGKDSYKKNS